MISSPTAADGTGTGAYAWYRGFVQGKTRIVMAWIFAIALGLSARIYPQWPGIALCFIGATIRFWASGYLRKDSRPAVGGPYAWVRNPLYLGTYLMALGTALAIEAWWLLAIGSVLFAAVYHYIILDEETKLKRIFGEPYLKYQTLVPRFFPRPWPASHARLAAEVNPETAHHRYDWPLSMKNKAYEAYASFAGLIGLVALIAWAWQTF
jgi:protein-S-isoprenylcysteine O-methyltransferase Ste14